MKEKHLTICYLFMIRTLNKRVVERNFLNLIFKISMENQQQSSYFKVKDWVLSPRSGIRHRCVHYYQIYTGDPSQYNRKKGELLKLERNKQNFIHRQCNCTDKVLNTLQKKLLAQVNLANSEDTGQQAKINYSLYTKNEQLDTEI